MLLINSIWIQQLRKLVKVNINHLILNNCMNSLINQIYYKQNYPHLIIKDYNSVLYNQKIWLSTQWTN